MLCVIVFDLDRDCVVDFWWCELSNKVPVQKAKFRLEYPDTDRFEISVEGERSLPLYE